MRTLLCKLHETCHGTLHWIHLFPTCAHLNLPLSNRLKLLNSPLSNTCTLLNTHSNKVMCTSLKLSPFEHVHLTEPTSFQCMRITETHLFPTNPPLYNMYMLLKSTSFQHVHITETRLFPTRAHYWNPSVSNMCTLLKLTSLQHVPITETHLFTTCAHYWNCLFLT